jgi:hypothetical protein
MSVPMYAPASTEDYIAVWQRVLRAWLLWPEPRIERFIHRFRPFAEPGMRLDRTPVWFLTHVLEPPSLRRRYQGGDRIGIDLEIEVAIVGEDSADHLQPNYDWEAARERVKAVLARYGASLPNPDDLAWWENELDKKA